MQTVGLTGLCDIQLPGHTVRLCDGAFFDFDGELYRDTDRLLGTVGSIDGLREGVGDEVPALELTFLPPEGSDPRELSQPGFQTARARFWIAEYDAETGQLTAPPTRPEFNGFLDRTLLKMGRLRELVVSVVSLIERFFELNIGNWLNSTWHKSVWPDELGHDNATGLSIPVAWGAASPANSSSPVTGGGSGGGGGGGRFNYDSPASS